MVRNKHIIIYLFLGLFAFTLICVTLYRYFVLEEVVLQQVVKEHLYIADKYKSKIWDTYPKAINQLKTYHYDQLLQNQNFIEFLQRSSNFFQNMQSAISLYDWSGTKLITNEQSDIINSQKTNSFRSSKYLSAYLDKYFLHEYISDNSINDAFRGQTAHCVLFKVQSDFPDNMVHDQSYLVSYIPLIDSIAGNFQIVGVVEVITDITQQKHNIVALEQRILIIFVIVFCLSCMVILHKITNAQAIIDYQVEVSRYLEEQKNRAEMDNLAKTDFMANISHELKTPLNAIIGFSQIMLSDKKNRLIDKKHRSYVSDIYNSSHHLLTVINDILDFSKASIDKLHIEKVEFNLNELVTATMRLMMPKAEEAKVRLVKHIPAKPIIIKADPQRLKQALLNILVNAIKFSQAETSVTLSISLNKAEEYVNIIVTDEGIGISEKDIPKALSPFGQVDNGLGNIYEGTGLGLPLTKKLLKLMGGNFDLRSLPNQGTEICLQLPYIKL